MLHAAWASVRRAQILGKRLNSVAAGGDGQKSMVYEAENQPIIGMQYGVYEVYRYIYI